MKAAFDTCILIDYLNGHQGAVTAFAAYSEKLISRITWIEVMVGVASGAGKRLKLPDALIYATARVENCPLLTRNTKDFEPSLPGVVVPYHIAGCS